MKKNKMANTMDQNSGCDCFVLKLKLKTGIWGMVKHLLSTLESELAEQICL